MTKLDIWNDFLEQLIENHFNEHKKTKEYEYHHNRLLHIDEMLGTNLTRDEKEMVDEVLFEIGTEKEHYAVGLYHQGLKDCVVILKEMGVL